MSNAQNDYAKLIGMQMTPVQMVDEITALRAALDQERADNAKLRAFAQHIRSTSTPISRFRMNVTMRSLGLLDYQNKPTALLSGRGEKK